MKLQFLSRGLHTQIWFSHLKRHKRVEVLTWFCASKFRLHHAITAQLVDYWQGQWSVNCKFHNWFNYWSQHFWELHVIIAVYNPKFKRSYLLQRKILSLFHRFKFAIHHPCYRYYEYCILVKQLEMDELQLLIINFATIFHQPCRHNPWKQMN